MTPIDQGEGASSIVDDDVLDRARELLIVLADHVERGVKWRQTERELLDEIKRLKKERQRYVDAHASVKGSLIREQQKTKKLTRAIDSLNEMRHGCWRDIPEVLDAIDHWRRAALVAVEQL